MREANTKDTGASGGGIEPARHDLPMRYSVSERRFNLITQTLRHEQKAGRLRPVGRRKHPFEAALAIWLVAHAGKHMVHQVDHRPNAAGCQQTQDGGGAKSRQIETEHRIRLQGSQMAGQITQVAWYRESAKPYPFHHFPRRAVWFGAFQAAMHDEATLRPGIRPTVIGKKVRCQNMHVMTAGEQPCRHIGGAEFVAADKAGRINIAQEQDAHGAANPIMSSSRAPTLASP